MKPNVKVVVFEGDRFVRLDQYLSVDEFQRAVLTTYKNPGVEPWNIEGLENSRFNWPMIYPPNEVVRALEAFLDAAAVVPSPVFHVELATKFLAEWRAKAAVDDTEEARIERLLIKDQRTHGLCTAEEQAEIKEILRRRGQLHTQVPMQDFEAAGARHGIDTFAKSMIREASAQAAGRSDG